MSTDLHAQATATESTRRSLSASMRGGAAARPAILLPDLSDSVRREVHAHVGAVGTLTSPSRTGGRECAASICYYYYYCGGGDRRQGRGRVRAVTAKV
jgi:hypothetical protein